MTRVGAVLAATAAFVLLALPATARTETATPAGNTSAAPASSVTTAPSVPLASTAPPDTAKTAPRTRVEARSSDLRVVGTVQGERMAIHLSRILDNAPVGNAAVAVMLRGTTHAAVAEADGSYSIQTPDLKLPGPASIEFLVTLGEKREELKGTLEGTAASELTAGRGNSRQLGWWVLNFAVCIGFLWLWSRRKSADA